jgi:hypothetical protein
VFYNFTVPSTGPEIIYADTLGSTWDTSIFVQTATGTNLTATGLPTGGAVCNDDGGLAGCNTGTQSQILLRLDPGSYRLVVSGCGGGGGTNVRFQHAPVGVGALNFLAAGMSAPMGNTTGTGPGRVNLGCNGGSREDTFYWYTCPSFVMAPFTASTCGAATWDTSLSQYSPGRPTPNTCADDSCSLQSSVMSTLPPGAGLHTLYVDGFSSNAGAYTVTVNRP